LTAGNEKQNYENRQGQLHREYGPDEKGNIAGAIVLDKDDYVEHESKANESSNGTTSHQHLYRKKDSAFAATA